MDIEDDDGLRRVLLAILSGKMEKTVVGSFALERILLMVKYIFMICKGYQFDSIIIVLYFWVFN